MLNSPPLFECRNITFERDDVPLFSGVGFQLHSSQAIQVVGANGAGKTTLLRILAGSLTATEGDVYWRGERAFKAGTEYREQLLYLGHSAGIKTSLTPRENLHWYRRLFSHLTGDVDGALHQVGLQGYEDVPCHTLSAGQQRRVALAKLYMSSAEFWVLDEPFTSIDVDGVDALETLMAAHLERGGCMVLTSHQRVGLNYVEALNLERFSVAC